jgi:hypothetical protein
MEEMATERMFHLQAGSLVVLRQPIAVDNRRAG